MKSKLLTVVWRGPSWDNHDLCFSSSTPSPDLSRSCLYLTQILQTEQQTSTNLHYLKISETVVLKMFFMILLSVDFSHLFLGALGFLLCGHNFHIVIITMRNTFVFQFSCLFYCFFLYIYIASKLIAFSCEWFFNAWISLKQDHTYIYLDR